MARSLHLWEDSGPKFKTKFLLIAGLLVSMNPVLAMTPDDHVFYIKKDSTNFCLTVSDEAAPATVKEDVHCETTFDSQKFLYSKSSQKIKSYSRPGFCLKIANPGNLGTFVFQAVPCADSETFTSPDLTGSTLALTSTAMTTSVGSHASNFEFLRNPNLNDGSGNFPNIPFTDCVLNDLTLKDHNAELHPPNIAGFQDGEKLYWQCQIGFTTPTKQAEVYSTCSSSGWDFDINKEPISCVRVQCDAPEVAKGSDIYVYDNNELKSLQLSKPNAVIENQNQNLIREVRKGAFPVDKPSKKIKLKYHKLHK